MKKLSKRTVQCLDVSVQSRLVFETLQTQKGPTQVRRLARKILKLKVPLTAQEDDAPVWVMEHYQKLIYLLIDRNYLEDEGHRLSLNDRSRKFLQKPQSVMVWENQLRWNATERRLYQELRKLRMQLARKENYRPYIIFPDQSLDELVRRRPAKLEALQNIYGWGPHRVNRYGMAILNCMNEVYRQVKESRFEELMNRSKRDSYQQVKSLFLAGESPEDIANKRGVKVSTINHMLSELYEAGAIDMYPWIEQNIPSATFEQGANYFRKHENARIKEAFLQLGIDYDVLKLCRLYVSQVEAREEELSAA